MTDENRQPFVILGAGRSGTTYLHSILGRHSKVAITNEAKLLDILSVAHAFIQIPAYQWLEDNQGSINPEYIPVFTPIFRKHARAAFEEFYRVHCPEKDFTHWGDKLLTVKWPRALLDLIPDMKVIVQIRDARDAVCSSRSWNERPEVKAAIDVASTHGIEDHARTWAGVYTSLVPHLDDCHVVRYEELMENPHKVVRGVLSFLGLGPEPACIEELEQKSEFISHGTTSHPAKSIGRWKTDLAPEELATVERICGAMMDRFERS